MKVIETSIPDVKIIEPTVFKDNRGFFFESWQKNDFNSFFFEEEVVFVQDNQSYSKKGVLRGLHYQKNMTQGKLVRVVSGTIFDVAVDVRKNSPTLGKWVGVTLSSYNMRQLWIPEGFAHGFYVISDEADVLYKSTDFYDPSSNITLDWNDKILNIDWPIASGIILSENDSRGKSFCSCVDENLLISI